jgi:hypothetical protein
MHMPFPNSASAPSACRASKPSPQRRATASNSATATSTPPRSTATKPRSARRCRQVRRAARRGLRHHQDLDRAPGRRQADPSLKDSLHKLRLEQLDLTLIHWPSPQARCRWPNRCRRCWKAREQGLTARSASRTSRTRCWRRRSTRSARPNIATNQVELHPYLQNRGVAAFAREHGIHVTAYMPLAYGKVLADPVIRRSRARCCDAGAGGAGWSLAKGYAVIPSSTRRENLAANLGALALELPRWTSPRSMGWSVASAW